MSHTPPELTQLTAIKLGYYHILNGMGALLHSKNNSNLLQQQQQNYQL